MDLMTIWKHWDGILTFVLMCSLLIIGGMWNETRRELQQARGVTTPQHLAIDYCTSLRYLGDVHSEKFKTCLETAEAHPLETALGLYGEARLSAETKSALEQKMKSGTLSQ